MVDWKGDSYNAILVVVECLIKTVHYKPIKTINDIADLAMVIINIIIRHHNLPESIIID